ncbi:MAG: GNAT family N-acetyltransferase [Desulfurococcales archaeon]|nr:GNAT family N-acetyltransferase [Desulfurococcales archaeon]
MRSDLRVKEANNGDLEVLLDLYTEFYSELRSRQGLRPRSREEYRGEVESYLSRDKIFLAETSSGKPIGFIRVSTREGCYWFEELYVKPEHRGKGVGRMLVERAEEYVKRHDPYVYIMVLPQDRRALGFWLHMGYKLLNTIELAKNLEEGDEEETRPIPLLNHILEMYKWEREEYTRLEGRFLELVERYLEEGGDGEQLLRIFVEALEAHLKKTIS